MSANPQYKVSATSLNLRSEPVERPSTRIASLPNGQTVTKLAVASDPEWWQVSTTIQNAPVTGFVAKKFLKPVASFTPPPTVSGITPVHLQENRSNITRDNAQGRAFPLGESGRPRRQVSTPAARTSSLAAIIDWLGVNTRARYTPGNGRTYCNIYAYDYCYLAGVYLPRVWWTRTAIQTLAQGGAVSPQYNVTVSEINANSLYQWFVDFGQQFGWQRTFDLTDLQNTANQGGVGIICAQRVDLNRSGHIVAVVPETAAQQAVRNGTSVVRPLQSQAGAVNFKYGTGTRAWWADAKFAHHGFWKHA